MIQRLLISAMLQGVLWVALMVVGLVIVAVGIEVGPQGLDAAVRATILHCLVVLIWLGPLICGLGNTLALLRMKSRGELRALACMGVGDGRIVPALVAVGALMAFVGWLLAEWCVPVIFEPQPPTWIWTDQGLWQPGSGVLVNLWDGSQTLWQDGGADLVRRSEPRLAPWSALRWDGSIAEKTEMLARISRIFGCIGLSVLSLHSVRFRHPLVALVGAGIVLVVIEVVAWTMGAQGQLPPALAGTVSAWSWLLLYVAVLVQPSTRIHRPV